MCVLFLNKWVCLYPKGDELTLNWLKIGWELVSLLIPTLLAVIVIALGYRKYVAPDLLAALEAAVKTTTTIASLGGIKRAEREGLVDLSKAVTTDIIRAKYPEMDLIKLAVSPSTWEQIEEALESNPAGVMELIEKYGHYFGMGEAEAGQKTLPTDF